MHNRGQREWMQLKPVESQHVPEKAKYDSFSIGVSPHICFRYLECGGRNPNLRMEAKSRINQCLHTESSSEYCNDASEVRDVRRRCPSPEEDRNTLEGIRESRFHTSWGYRVNGHIHIDASEKMNNVLRGMSKQTRFIAFCFESTYIRNEGRRSKDKIAISYNFNRQAWILLCTLMLPANKGFG